ncbi:MAG: restriction endonuclease subunit S [Elusimicrobiales bacterium]
MPKQERKIPKGWKETTLGAVAEVQTGPFGSQLHNEDYVSDGIPIITVENLINNSITHTADTPMVSVDDNARLKKYSLKKGDLVFSRVGSVDRCGYVSAKEDGWMFSGRLLRVRSSASLHDRYTFYWMTQEAIKEFVRKVAVGATMPSINTELLSRVPIVVPPLPEQRAIAGVLSSLDDKIELLRDQNKTLEAMVATIWQKMFVGDVNPKWKEGSLLDLIVLTGGGTPKTDVLEYWNGSVPWLSAKDITANHKNFIFHTEKTISDLGLANCSAKLLPKYSTVISARGTVGNYCILSSPMASSQSNYGILPLSSNCYFFTYFLIAFVVAELKSAAYGSIFDTITTETFHAHKVRIPTKDQIIYFEKIATPFLESMHNNTAQIQTLSTLRDTLLPKLMKGELRVSNAK